MHNCMSMCNLTALQCCRCLLTGLLSLSVFSASFPLLCISPFPQRCFDMFMFAEQPESGDACACKNEGRPHICTHCYGWPSKFVESRICESLGRVAPKGCELERRCCKQNDKANMFTKRLQEIILNSTFRFWVSLRIPNFHFEVVRWFPFWKIFLWIGTSLQIPNYGTTVAWRLLLELQLQVQISSSCKWLTQTIASYVKNQFEHLKNSVHALRERIKQAVAEEKTIDKMFRQWKEFRTVGMVACAPKGKRKPASCFQISFPLKIFWLFKKPFARPGFSNIHFRNMKAFPL